LTNNAEKKDNADLICVSHLRWNFVFQRPQHLMTRLARERRVFFFEEPLFDAEQSHLQIDRDQNAQSGPAGPLRLGRVLPQHDENSVSA